VRERKWRVSKIKQLVRFFCVCGFLGNWHGGDGGAAGEKSRGRKGRERVVVVREDFRRSSLTKLRSLHFHQWASNFQISVIHYPRLSKTKVNLTFVMSS